MDVVNVVCALIQKDNKILIARRNHGDEQVYGKWEFPGGKVEPGEDEKKAIEREMKEEFELSIKAIDYVTENIYEYPNKTVNLKLYRCEYVSGEFKLHDHFEYKYVNKQDLLNYEFCPADIGLAKYILNNE